MIPNYKGKQRNKNANQIKTESFNNDREKFCHTMNKNNETLQDFKAENYNAKILADEEIIRLAKENSPRLLSKFKSAYPDFFEKLATINPNLQNSEIIFCIYLKLRLSTKEIAIYTFVTPKAIQNRKNRLRKKLGISSDTDIYKWFDNL